MMTCGKFKVDLEAAMRNPKEVIGKAGAKHSEADRTMLTMGYHACMMASGMESLPAAKRAGMRNAAESFNAAGAQPTPAAGAVDVGTMHFSLSDSEADKPGHGNSTPAPVTLSALECRGQNSTVDAVDNPQPAAPQLDVGASGNGSSVDQVAAGAVIFDFAKRMHEGHQLLMDIAHTCCAKVSEGVTCGRANKTGARHSAETMGHLMAAHTHLIAAGARCGKANPVPGGQPTAVGEAEGHGSANSAGGKMVNVGALVKSLAGDLAATTVENVIKALQPQLDELSKRVEEIARDPLPPLAARSEAAVAKMLAEHGLQPVDKTVGGGDPASCAPNLEQMADAFAKMSKEDQTLLLIRAAQKRPMVAPGSGTRLPS